MTNAKINIVIIFLLHYMECISREKRKSRSSSLNYLEFFLRFLLLDKPFAIMYVINAIIKIDNIDSLRFNIINPAITAQITALQLKFFNLFFIKTSYRLFYKSLCIWCEKKKALSAFKFYRNIKINNQNVSVVIIIPTTQPTNPPNAALLIKSNLFIFASFINVVLHYRRCISRENMIITANLIIFLGLTLLL